MFTYKGKHNCFLYILVYDDYLSQCDIVSITSNSYYGHRTNS